MNRRLIPLVVAVVLALVGTTAVLVYVRSADERAIAGKQAVTVLVAKQLIPAGTTGEQVRSPDYTEKIRLPAETVPPDVLGSVPAELDRLVVTADIQPKQLVFRGAFGEKASVGGGLALPKGKMAVSVQLPVPAQVANFVRPGSKVAIFGSFTMRSDTQRVPAGDGLARRPEANQATRLLLSGVEVLAIGVYGLDGTTAAPKPDPATNGAAGSENQQSSGDMLTVTVAVNQADAQRLVHSAQTSSLYLALQDDSSVVKADPGVDNSTLYR
jgi:pilus assembly protein CpaB